MYSERNEEPEPTTGPEGGYGAHGGYGWSERRVDVESVMRREGGEVADLVQRARSRSDSFHYGDDRAIGSRPNWAARDSKQLYAYATVNNEPGTAEELGQVWGRHGGELNRIADDLYNAIMELGSVWVGQGSGAAQGALVGIANSGAQASEAARTMQDRLVQQASAASKLKTMPAPKDFDPGAETAAMLAGGPAAMVADLKKQYDEAQAVKAQQLAFLEAYTEELSQIDSTTPSFGPESLGLKPLSDGIATEARTLGAVGTVSVSGVDAGGVPAGHGAAPGVTAGGVNAVTGGGTDSPRGPVTPVAGPGVGAGSVSAPTPSGGGGLNVGQSLGVAAAGGALGYAGVKALSGKRTGSKKNIESPETAEAITAAEAAEAVSSGASETVASANQTGSAAPASVNVAPMQNQGVVPSAGGVVGAGPAATPAVGPMGGMGAMGGAASAGQQDEKEHTHASFLIEPDPDDTFGATESAAPPVLGAWDPDDEGR
ncbi:hypothetical protein [Saccharomonospora sp.]|uniref:WXG100 family type VII secretion target n=1 Tax=Saccharomonospora sp. TaxID=33913 RepID=UPI00261E1669|nr:hypothetical protein [Saccharomonospora sp.]